jgi:hypothetical protein
MLVVVEHQAIIEVLGQEQVAQVEVEQVVPFNQLLLHQELQIPAVVAVVLLMAHQQQPEIVVLAAPA